MPNIIMCAYMHICTILYSVCNTHFALRKNPTFNICNTIKNMSGRQETVIIYLQNVESKLQKVDYTKQNLQRTRTVQIADEN